MSKGINKVIIVGNLGQDTDVRFTQDGTCMANLSVATDESYKDKQTGQIVPRTEWHRCVAGGRLAEICKDYLKKGSKVYIEGRLQTRKWQNNQGQDQYTTEIRMREMVMLDGKSDGQQPQNGYQKPQNQPVQNTGQQGYQAQQPQQRQVTQAPPVPADAFDDDIPFMRLDSFI